MRCLSVFLLIIAAVSIAQPDTLWTRTYDIGEYDKCFSVLPVEGGCFVLAGSVRTGSYGDAYVFKIDADGNVLWELMYGSPTDGEYCEEVIATADGGYAAVGYSSDTDLDRGPYDFLLIKLDASGNLQWSGQYGTSSTDQGMGLVQTEDDGYLLGGWMSNISKLSYTVRTDSLGNLIWSRTYGTSTASESCEGVIRYQGNYLLGGWSVEGDSASYYQARLIDMDGEILGVYKFNTGTSNEFAWDICRSDQDGFVLAGQSYSFGNDSQGYVVCADPGGSSQWSCQMGYTDSDAFYAIERTLYSGYIAVGSHQIPSEETDMWAVKLDGDGAVLWEQTWDFGAYDYADAVAQTHDGGYLICGETYTGGIGGDIVLVRLQPPAGIEDQESDHPLQILSNPASSAPVFILSLDETRNARLDVMDISGRIVDRVSSGRLSTGTHSISGNALPVGVYTARLSWEGGSSSVRFAVVR